MKIAVIDTGFGEQTDTARAFLPELLKGLIAQGDRIELITNESVEETAPVLANRLNEQDPDVYLIWSAETIGWAALPLLNPQIATIAVGHADEETYYAPVRHYRPFLTRVVGATPETSVGFVINCVIEKERVEWISYDEADNLAKSVETFRSCFEKAASDAHAAPREISPGFPPMKARRATGQSWFSRMKARIMN